MAIKNENIPTQSQPMSTGFITWQKPIEKTLASWVRTTQ